MATWLILMITAKQLYDKLKNIRVGNSYCQFTEKSCENLLPTIEHIEELKREKNAIILVHNYVAPQILYSVADHVGDSYGLAKVARESEADIIVFAAVRFMAETAKILNPEKIVLDPNPNGGCTLADGITAQDVKALRIKFPEHTFVCYINTTAEVKALCDVCVTSSNVYKIMEQIENNKIYFLPDRLMGENVKNYLRDKGVGKEVEVYDGTCYVHEEYLPESVDQVRKNFSNVEILVHPECSHEVVELADLVGSTEYIIKAVNESASDSKWAIGTEINLVNRLGKQHPERLIMSLEPMVCVCTTMYRIDPPHLLWVLENLLEGEVVNHITVPVDIADNARLALNRMLAIKQ